MISSVIVALVVGVIAPPPARRLPGRWSGELEAVTAPSDAKPVLSQATLRLTKYGSFELKMGLTMTGRWTYEGQVLSLHPETVGGRSVYEMASTMSEDGRRTLMAPVDLVVSDDGRSLTTAVTGVDSAPRMIFTRR